MKTRFLALFLALLMVLSLTVGCTDNKTATTTTAETVDRKVKVALILEGPISDMGWNATAYEGLKKIEALGAQVHYTENVPTSSVGDAMRQYANDDYDVIFLSTNSYQDVVKEVAPELPDSMFLAINSVVTLENVRSFSIKDEEQGFLMGALAALLTETNKVGFIGGLPIQPILNGQKGFEQGVKYVDESVVVLSEMTGSFDDVNRAKEMALAFIGDGADIVAPIADQSSLGVMQAAEEGNARGIGSGSGQEAVAPTADIVNIIKDTSLAYEAAFKAWQAGELKEEIVSFGAAEGVVYLDEFIHDVDDDVKTEIKAIYEKLVSGEITIKLD